MAAMSGSQSPVGGWQAASAPPTRAAFSVVGTPRTEFRLPVTPRKLEDRTGMTPEAKRPLARDTIQVAISGERPLTHEELTSAFYGLLRRAEQEEGFTNQLHEAVTYNAELLNTLGSSAAKSHVALNLIPPKFEQLENEMKSNMLTLQNNIGEAVVNGDKRLRDQLDAVMQEIDEKLKSQYATLGEIINAIGQEKAKVAEAGPAPEHHLPDMARLLAQLQSEAKGKVRKVKPGMALQMEITSPTLNKYRHFTVDAEQWEPLQLNTQFTRLPWLASGVGSSQQRDFAEARW